MTLLYLAGPMTGQPDHNYPAFNAAAARLRADGYTVANPAEAGKVDGWEWADYVKRGLRAMLHCDGVALLPGWHESRGARLEYDVAHALKMRGMPVDDWLMVLPDGFGNHYTKCGLDCDLQIVRPGKVQCSCE